MLNSEDSYNGYTLFAGNSNSKTFLIDNCGYIVNEWSGNDWPELSVYLLEDGSILKPSYGYIERRSWDDNLDWSYDLHNIDIHNHHDIEPLPNGNFLIINRKFFESDVLIASGRNPGTIEDGGEIDGIVEIEPVGANGAIIVWEWNMLDHTVQDFDAAQENFGNLSDHPELLNINFNYDNADEMWDWLHVNGVDYNTELDQIIFSSRHTSEIYIIDHSTTTEEASEHSGGAQGRGGDILWRWGNPQLYGQGGEAERKLFGQHDPKWIPTGYPDEGKITVFNNGDQRPGDWSSIHIIDSEMNSDGSYNLSDGSFLPTDYHWSWNGDVQGETMSGPIESGVNIQPNGNFLICEFWGRFSEVTPDGEVVWVYRNPVGDPILQQGEFGFKDVFRAERYPTTYAAFDGKDLSPGGLIEGNNLNSENCNIFISLNNPSSLNNQNTISFHPNPVDNYLSIIVDNIYNEGIQWEIVSMSGQPMMSGNEINISIDNLNPGLYFLFLRVGEKTYFQKLIKE